MARSSDRPVEFWQSTDDRPWWHTEHVNAVRDRVKEMSIPELRGLAEEMKGAVATLQSQMETAAPDISHIREMAKKLGPAVAFDAGRLATAISEKYDISTAESHELIEEYDWWKSVRGALGFIKQKHSNVVAEITRRRSKDAEQAVFDIKGKIKRACDYMDRDEDDDIEDAYKLLLEVRERLAEVGP